MISPPGVTLQRSLIRIASVMIDRIGVNLAVLHESNTEREALTTIRQVRCPNNIVQQDHQAIKRFIRFHPVAQEIDKMRILLGGIETMHMIAKGRMKDAGIPKPSVTTLFLA